MCQFLDDKRLIEGEEHRDEDDLYCLSGCRDRFKFIFAKDLVCFSVGDLC